MKITYKGLIILTLIIFFISFASAQTRRAPKKKNISVSILLNRSVSDTDFDNSKTNVLKLKHWLPILRDGDKDISILPTASTTEKPLRFIYLKVAMKGGASSLNNRWSFVLDGNKSSYRCIPFQTDISGVNFCKIPFPVSQFIKLVQANSVAAQNDTLSIPIEATVLESLRDFISRLLSNS